MAKGIAAAVGASMAEHGVPGAAVAVARAGVPYYSHGFGIANLETASPVTPTTVFRYGSITKQFAAAAAIKLASQGKLDLGAPVFEYLPVFKQLKPFSTLELMHQTAGLHSDESEELPSQAFKARDQIELAAEIASQAKPFDFDPGTAWLYSNANFIVLGAVIEQVTKVPLAQAMEALVYGPLNLSSMAIDTPDQIVAGRASGYSQTGDPGRPLPMPPTPTLAGWRCGRDARHSHGPGPVARGVVIR
ncbi:MAG: serine hydrolase domain-containing protein [Novosphingobium sp.]